MGHLSTHVLDTMNGCPAAGMQVTLQRLEGDRYVTIRQIQLNSDGRNDGGPLLDQARDLARRGAGGLVMRGTEDVTEARWIK